MGGNGNNLGNQTDTKREGAFVALHPSFQHIGLALESAVGSALSVYSVL